GRLRRGEGCRDKRGAVAGLGKGDEDFRSVGTHRESAWALTKEWNCSFIPMRGGVEEADFVVARHADEGEPAGEDHICRFIFDVDRIGDDSLRNRDNAYAVG